jgi:hypothetical protein
MKKNGLLAGILLIIFVVIIAVYHDDLEINQKQQSNEVPQDTTKVSQDSTNTWPGMVDDTVEDIVGYSISTQSTKKSFDSNIDLSDSLCVIMYQAIKSQASCDNSIAETVEPDGRAARGRIVNGCFYFIEDNIKFTVDLGKIKRLPAKIMTDDPTYTDLWDAKSKEQPYLTDLKEMLTVWTDLVRYPEQLEKEYGLLLSSGILILENQTPADNKRVLDEYKKKRAQLIAKEKTNL